MAEYYVEATTGSDANAGTSAGSGNAWATIQHALDTITPGTNGDRINVKAGETVSESSLDMATHGAPASHTPLIIQGYTTSAGDGGIATIDCGGSAGFTDLGDDWDAVYFIDLNVSNFGSAAGFDVDNYCRWINCEIHNGTSHGIRFDNSSMVIGCYIHNIGGNGIHIDAERNLVYRCVIGDFESASNTLDNGIRKNVPTAGAEGDVILQNVIFGTTTGFSGIKNGSRGGSVINNSIYCSAASTDSGIELGGDGALCLNNLIEGFSGTGGAGIDFGNEFGLMFGGNGIRNCASAAVNKASEQLYDFGDDETLGASPFNISGTVTTADFIPADTGNVKQGSLPDEVVGAP